MLIYNYRLLNNGNKGRNSKRETCYFKVSMLETIHFFKDLVKFIKA